MSFPSSMQDPLRPIAARQLRRTAKDVPEVYITQLRNFLTSNPDDTNFVVTADVPTRGYGNVTCLDPGCSRVPIPLTHERSMVDGGRSIGIGGFDAYQAHCLTVQHSRARAMRMKTTIPAGRSSVLDALDGRAAAAAAPAVNQARNSGAPKDKPLPSSTVPRKRSSDVAQDEDDDLIDLTKDDDDDDISIVVPDKKRVKKEPEVKRDPLQSFDVNSLGSGPRRLSSPTAGIKGVTPNRLRAVLRATQADIKEVKAEISQLRDRAKRTKSSFHVLKQLRAKEDRLEQLEREERSATKALGGNGPASPTRPGIVKKEEPVDSMLNARQQQAVAGPSRIAQPPPQPYIKPEDVQPYLHAGYPPFPHYPHVPPPQFPMMMQPGAFAPPPFPYMPAAAYAPPPFPFAPPPAPASNPVLPIAQPGARTVNAGLHPGVSAAIARIPAGDGMMNAMDAMAGVGAPLNQGYNNAVNRALVAPNVGGGPDDSDDEDNLDQPEPIVGYGHSAVNQFILDAGNAEAFDENATVNDAVVKLGLPDHHTPLPGMEITLMAHQHIGVAWMAEHETSDKIKHYGGILADEMGLGKTVQMIGTIVLNQSDNPAAKGTLIIAPLALLEQWKLEIETKTNPGLFSIHIYHGSNRNKAKSKKALQSFDIVLTTFQTLAMELPSALTDKEKRRRKKANDFIEDDDDEEAIKKKMGPLFKVNWHRVVLDEAQFIRNRGARGSQAVAKLKAKHRWCLTGTPVINSLADVYSYMRFLKVRPWYDWSHFNEHIVRQEKKDPGSCGRKLQGILKTCLLRRHKESMLDGKRLIELPNKEVVMSALTFSLEEQNIYAEIEGKAQAVFNKFRRQGTVFKNYHHVLVMLLRLRQLCSHPSLIQEEGDIPLMQAGDDQKEAADEIYRAIRLLSQDWVDQIKVKLLKNVLENMRREKESIDAEAEDDSCAICFDIYEEPVVTPCHHVYCKECVVKLFDRPNEEGVAFRADQRPCPSCRQPFNQEHLFLRKAFEPTESEIDAATGDAKAAKDDSDSGDDDVDMPSMDDVFGPSSSKGSSKRKSSQGSKASKKGKGKAKAAYDEDSDDSLDDFIVEDGEDEDEKDAIKAARKRKGKKRAVVLDSDDEMLGVSEAEESGAEDDADVFEGAVKKKKKNLHKKVPNMDRFLPSTKHMMDTLKTWAKEYPTDKTMLISQWTSCLDLVAHYLEENDFRYTRYQGSMSKVERDESIRQFMRESGGPKVMLMSLKAGGVGLNLTRANRVISLDLGWSEAVESQAFDRVHRLGQQKDVLVSRLIIANTVEDRILAIQAKKKGLADSSLGEGTGQKLGRLSVRDLAFLFGLGR